MYNDPNENGNGGGNEHQHQPVPPQMQPELVAFLNMVQNQRAPVQNQGLNLLNQPADVQQLWRQLLPLIPQYGGGFPATLSQQLGLVQAALAPQVSPHQLAQPIPMHIVPQQMMAAGQQQQDPYHNPPPQVQAPPPAPVQQQQAQVSQHALSVAEYILNRMENSMGPPPLVGDMSDNEQPSPPIHHQHQDFPAPMNMVQMTPPSPAILPQINPINLQQQQQQLQQQQQQARIQQAQPPPPVAPSTPRVVQTHQPTPPIAPFTPPMAAAPPPQQAPPQQQQQPQPVVAQPQEAPQPVQEEPKRRRGGGRKRKTPLDGPPRVDEALAYLRIIKQTFTTDVPVYHRFLEIMKDFRAQRIDTPDVIEQVADLLYSSPDLVLGFNTFLPTGFQISLTADKKYVFTSPLSQPRVLPSPSERLAAGENAAPAPSDVETEPEHEPRREDSSITADSDTEMEEGEMKTEDDDDSSSLREEVVRSGSGNSIVSSVSDLSIDFEDMENDTLKLFKLICLSFKARPHMMFKFVAWMELYISHCQYYARHHAKQENVEEEDEEEEDYDQPGPAPPPRQPRNSDEQEEDEQMEVDETRLEKEKMKELEKSNWEHLISTLAEVCAGEPKLLATMLEFVPQMKRAIIVHGDTLAKKIRDVFLSDDSFYDGDRGDVATVDAELVREMERHKIGVSPDEQLKVWVAPNPQEDKGEEMMIVMQKTQRVLFEHLKQRTTKAQLKNIILLMSMYLNVDITKEEMVAELPKVMGCLNTEAEKMIRTMLGMEKSEADRPENDPDAVERCDLPAKTHGKRGLRDQKLMQQARTVNLATVCTLGPSYRLMRGDREEHFEGRKELDPQLKNVLNDTWTSYPSWSSEEAGTTTVKKSNLEEFHCKTEDERYEMDIIVDSNRTIIEQLQKTLRDIENMSDEEKKTFKLDEKLNCPSKATLNRVLTKVYTNQAGKMIELTRNNPKAGLKQILEGLIEKDHAWSKFQQETNRAWRDACDKTLATNLNCLNNQQRQYDQRAFKSKPLINAIEAIYEDRKKNGDLDSKSAHMTLDYSPNPRVYRDVNDVTGFFFSDLPGGKYDKDRSKIVLFRILMEWVCQPAQHVEISLTSGETFTFNGDENEDENLVNLLSMDGRFLAGERVVPGAATDTINIISPTEKLTTTQKFQKELHHLPRRIFYGDDNVYIFIRFHHFAIERFAKILATQAVLNQEHEESQKKTNKWQEGTGAELNSQKVLEENMRMRRDAVFDIRNIRSPASSYYDMTLREMKSLGNNQIDSATFEENVRQYFPGDVAILYSIDKLFSTLAKNIHHATTGDSSENPIKLYLKYRKPMMEAKTPEDLEKIESEYAAEAEENLRGKNTYRFEFVQEQGAPYCNIWLIQREEKESDAEDGDDDGKEGEKKDSEDVGTPLHPASNDDGEDEDVVDEEMDETPANL